jgi:replicative DNA helicase
MTTETIETAIIGIILRAGDPDYRGIVKLDEIYAAIRPDMFYYPSCGCMYEAILALAGGNQPVDIVTVPDKAREMFANKVSTSEILEIYESAGSVDNYRWYIGQMEDAYTRRVLSHQYIQASELLKNPVMEAAEVIRDVEKHHKDCLAGVKQDSIISLGSDIQEELTKPPIYRLFKTNLTNVDRAVEFCRGDMIMITGDAGIGKTSLTLNLLWRAQEAGKRCLYISLDTPKHKMFNRLVAIKKGYPLTDIKRNRNLWKKLTKTDVENIWFGYHDCDTVEYIHRAIVRQNIDVVFIDHNLKLETTRSISNQVEKYDYMANYVSSMALKTNSCVFLIGHTNRMQGQRIALRNIYGAGGWGREATTALHLEGITQENVEYQQIKLSCLKTRDQPPTGIYLAHKQEYVTYEDSNKEAYDEVNGGGGGLRSMRQTKLDNVNI